MLKSIFERAAIVEHFNKRPGIFQYKMRLKYTWNSDNFLKLYGVFGPLFADYPNYVAEILVQQIKSRLCLKLVSSSELKRSLSSLIV